MHNKISKIRSWQRGNNAAKRYERANPGVRKATSKEDMFMHIDYWHEDRGVDVKGNNLPDEIWIEFKNVRGNHGWLFGEATTIAFDMPELTGFVVVDRLELADYCKQNVDFSCKVPRSQAYKKVYQRDGRKDMITKLCLQDLQTLDSYRVIEYCQTYLHPGEHYTCRTRSDDVS